MFNLFGILAYEIHVYSYYFYLSFLAFLFFILGAFLKGAKKFEINKSLFLLIFVYILSLLLSIAYTKDGIGLARTFLILITIYVCFNSTDLIYRCLKVFLYFAYFIGMVSFLVQLDLISSIWSRVADRNASIFFDPNFASAFLGLGALSSLITISHKYKKIISYLFLSIACFFTFSKAGALALFLSSIIYLTFYISLRYKLLLFTLLPIILFRIYHTIDLTMFRTEQGLNARDDLWKFSFNKVILEQNFLGFGNLGMQEILKKVGFENVSTHNYYFDSLLTYGLVPTVIIIIIMLIVMTRLIRAKDDTAIIVILLFIQSNSILISFGGIGYLSLILTLVAMHSMRISVRKL